MKKIEYKITTKNNLYDQSDVADTLNEFGEEGWDLVWLIPPSYSGGTYSFYFKREKFTKPVYNCVNCRESKLPCEIQNGYCRDCQWLAED